MAALLFVAHAQGTQKQIPVVERDGVVYVDNPEVGLWQGREPVPFHLELEQVFGVNEQPAEATLAWIKFVAVDRDGNVYVLDGTDHRIVSFGPDGTLRWYRGREGEGPGELNRVRGMVWDGGQKLYLANQSGARIDAWSLEGRFLDSRLLRDVGMSPARLVGFQPPDLILMERMVAGRIAVQVQPLRVTDGWHAGEAFVIDTAEGVQLPSGTGMWAQTRVAGDQIAVGNLMRYELRFYGLGGRLRRVVRRADVPLVPAAIDLDRRAIGTMGEVGAPVRLASGHWLAQASWPANIDNPIAYLRGVRDARSRRETTWLLDLYDREGRLLLSRRWEYPAVPELGSLRLATSDGRLYTVVRDPFPQVRRYRVTIAE